MLDQKFNTVARIVNMLMFPILLRSITHLLLRFTESAGFLGKLFTHR